MAFERNHTPDVVTALEMAHAIARRMGGVDYLKDRAKMVSNILMSRETVPDRITVSQGRESQLYRITRLYPKPYVRRTVKVTDLQRIYPSAYRAAVTVSKPEKPYQLRLEAEFGGRVADEWAKEKAAGKANWESLLEQRYGQLVWDRVDTQTRALFELRRDAKSLDDRVTDDRAALTQFIIEHELPATMRGFGDGRLVLRENPMKTSVDYDVLERQFPAAASLIKRTTFPGTPQLRFDKITPDPEEGDDSDDSARGIWKG